MSANAFFLDDDRLNELRVLTKLLLGCLVGLSELGHFVASISLEGKAGSLLFLRLSSIGHVLVLVDVLVRGHRFFARTSNWVMADCVLNRSFRLSSSRATESSGLSLCLCHCLSVKVNEWVGNASLELGSTRKGKKKKNVDKNRTAFFL